MIASPCNKVCVIDAQSGLCRGCCRTLDEIARWAEIGERGRKRILGNLPRRRAVVPGGGIMAGSEIDE